MFEKIMKTLIFLVFFFLLVSTIFLGIYFYRRHQNSRSSLNSSNSVMDKKIKQSQRKKKREKAGFKTAELLKVGIFLTDEEGKRISSAYLCHFNRERKTLEFYFLEGDTLVELSQEAYGELKAKIPDMPQIIRFSDSLSYGKNKVGLEIATSVLNDVLGSDAEYFIALKEEAAKKVFYFNAKRDSVLLRKFQTMLLSGVGIEDFVRKNYHSKATNFSQKEILSLLKECQNWKAEDIHFYKIPGSEKNRGIMIEKEEVLEFIYGEKEKTN